MGFEIASTYITLKAEGASLVRSAVSGATSAVREFASAATSLGGILSAGALGAGFVAAVKSAAEAEQGQRMLAAAIRSTGGAAGWTVAQVNDLATALAKTTLYEDDAIVSAARLLTSFTAIRGDVFRDALSAATDLSAAMGQDLQSSIIQVGKALNDPVQGITALSRVGVSFSDAQKNVIKSLVETNQVAQAQKIIIAELNTEFGGQAAAAAQSFAGQLRNLQKDVGELGESIGTLAIPRLIELVKWLREAADLLSGRPPDVGKLNLEAQGFSRPEAAAVTREAALTKEIDRLQELRRKGEETIQVPGVERPLTARVTTPEADAAIAARIAELEHELREIRNVAQVARVQHDARALREAAQARAAAEKKAMEEVFAQGEKLDREGQDRQRLGEMLASTKAEQAAWEERERHRLEAEKRPGRWAQAVKEWWDQGAGLGGDRGRAAGQPSPTFVGQRVGVDNLHNAIQDAINVGEQQRIAKATEDVARLTNSLVELGRLTIEAIKRVELKARFGNND